MTTPLDVSLEDLGEAAEQASNEAARRASEAGISPVALTRQQAFAVRTEPLVNRSGKAPSRQRRAVA
jgi:hypothetical protein